MHSRIQNLLRLCSWLKKVGKYYDYISTGHEKAVFVIGSVTSVHKVMTLTSVLAYLKFIILVIHFPERVIKYFFGSSIVFAFLTN